MVSVGRTRPTGLNKGPYFSQWISFSRKFSPAAGDWPKFPVEISACINSILSPFFFSYSYKSSCCYNILIYRRASMYKHLVITELLSKVTTFWKHQYFPSLMHQSIPPSPPLPPPLPPGLLQGICPPCQSQGWGICKFRAFTNRGATVDSLLMDTSIRWTPL